MATLAEQRKPSIPNIPPSGYKFHPSDQELILDYLFPKITNRPFKNWEVQEYDLYCDKNPSQIWEQFAPLHRPEEDDLYVFTRLKKLYPNSQRIRRTAGTGTWVGEDLTREIKGTLAGEVRVLGSRKRFRFCKSNTHDDNRWIMMEYSLDPSILSTASIAATDYVICQIRKNLKKSEKAAVGVLGKTVRVDGERGELNMNPDDVNFFDELNDIAVKADSGAQIVSNAAIDDELREELAQELLQPSLCPLDLQVLEQTFNFDLP